MENLESYQVRLEAFQGPLDLLLFLIRKRKIDVQDIPISTITGEYLTYLDQLERIDLEREAEYLLMAALLIHIKSQMLLPREQMPDSDEEDPRRLLVDRLLDYQKVRAASSLLREKEQEQLKQWQRMSPPPLNIPEPAEQLEEVSLFVLAEAFFELMRKKEQQDVALLKGKDVSIEEKMTEMVNTLKTHGYLDFFEYFSAQNTVEEALVSFFCLLELIKARVVVAVQESLFHSIKVWLRDGSAG